MSRALMLLVLLLGGCHYYIEDDDDSSDLADAGFFPGDDGGGAGFTDAQTVACDPASILPNGFVPVEEVSSGAVTSEEESPGVFVTEIDATAGGAEGQTTSPFVYLDLLADGGAARVELDDVAAFESTEWDLAIKRYVIRANGGDSGPGQGAVATLPSGELTFDDTVPELLADDWTTGGCELISDDVGGPATRFSNWYQVMNGRFLPRAIVHVVRLRDGSHAEIDIDTYYADGGNPNRGGIYRLRWRRF